MPSLSSTAEPIPYESRYARLTNGQVMYGTQLIQKDVCIDTASGKILARIPFDISSNQIAVVDCRGKIVAPGFIDVQINGAYGFDFSNSDCLTDPEAFVMGLQKVNHRLIQSGTTSYLPTMTSQFTDTYHKVLRTQVR